MTASHRRDGEPRALTGGVFLVGGGWDAPEVYAPLLRAAGAGGRRIGCLIVDEGDGEEQFARYAPGQPPLP
ncbi:hypothetical protein AB0N16_08075 [Streptomyces sp. NPDC051105]|uniref:hypothetical protein n=1 Tax=Streptomyces sp. NPDC051105 TaxID=3154843 RepID=UPI003448F4C8